MCINVFYMSVFKIGKVGWLRGNISFWEGGAKREVGLVIDWLFIEFNIGFVL